MDTFTQISLILILAAGFSWLMQSFRLPIMLGHLLTGILVGPVVLNIIHHKEVVEVFSQFGITALLFIVGLGLAPQVMREVGKVSLLVGASQIVVTGILGFLVAYGFGFSSTASFYLAAAMAFSSTIIVSKFLTDRREIGALHGKIAIGILLVQDIVATFLLIFLSASEQSAVSASDIVYLIAKGVLAGGILYFFCTRFLPRLSRLFALSQEFLFLFSLAWGLGMALLFRAMGFSLEIGALVAGVTLAASPYHYEIAAKMKLLRDFFLVPFFVLLGAQILFTNLSTIIWPLVAMTAFVVFGKPLIVLGSLLRMGYRRQTAFSAGIVLGQVSEFSFLLMLLGERSGAVPRELVTLTALLGLCTMTGSVVMMQRIKGLYKWVQKFLGIFERTSVSIGRGRANEERFDTIMFGCHRVGEDFLSVLRKRGDSYLVVDYDPATISFLEKNGVPCRYGDVADNEFLDELGLGSPKLIVSTLPDIDTNAFLLAKARKKNKQGIIILTAQSIDEAILLYKHGANYVILPHALGGNYASLLLEKHGTSLTRFEQEKARHLKHLATRRQTLASTPTQGVH